MTQISHFWGGTTVGDATAAPYSDDEFSDFIEFLLTYDRISQGILPSLKTGYTGELEVWDAGGSTARVQTGAALVDGKLYLNSSAVDFTVSGNAVYWLIGLVKNFAAQTVRAFARGTYASEAAALASLVRTEGATWEIPLAVVLTTALGGVDVILDQRVFAKAAGAPIAFAGRLGYTDTDWTDSTTAVAIPTTAKIQVGSNFWQDPVEQDAGEQDVVFPVPFTKKPLIFYSYPEVGVGFQGIVFMTRDVSITGFTMAWKLVDGSASIDLFEFQWLAIGE